VTHYVASQGALGHAFSAGIRSDGLCSQHRGETTKRSDLDPDRITGVLRAQGAAALRGEPELSLVLDGMELRRPEASAQGHLMQVKALDGHLVNGYRSFNVLGLGEGDARGLLYHHLLSSTAPRFRSENQIIADAIAATEAQLANFAGPQTWVGDCGFDWVSHLDDKQAT
jgi:hypothetical protein